MSTPKAEAPKLLRWRDVAELARGGNVPPPRRVEKTDAEWRAALSDEQYHVTRHKGTERPFSSELCALFEPGRYLCVCCGTPLFDATTKFESGTGWPSFTAPLTPDVVAYHMDTTYGMQRIETTCNVCDAHLGHVFPDGPPPSGLRFCINAVSLEKVETDD
jgi:peptide-methionine (R)-S-oxide reductase